MNFSCNAEHKIFFRSPKPVFEYQNESWECQYACKYSDEVASTYVVDAIKDKLHYYSCFQSFDPRAIFRYENVLWECVFGHGCPLKSTTHITTTTTTDPDGSLLGDFITGEVLGIFGATVLVLSCAYTICKYYNASRHNRSNDNRALEGMEMQNIEAESQLEEGLSRDIDMHPSATSSKDDDDKYVVFPLAEDHSASVASASIDANNCGITILDAAMPLTGEENNHPAAPSFAPSRGSSGIISRIWSIMPGFAHKTQEEEAASVV